MRFVIKGELLRMKALVVDRSSLSFSIQDFPVPKIRSDEVLVKVHAAALNHRDLNMPSFYRQMKEKNESFPVSTYVVGSDGAGVIEAKGSDVRDWNVGDSVIISSLHFCGECPACLSGQNVACQYGNILGSSGLNGTIAHYVAVPAKLLLNKPEHLKFSEAAALPMGFGTAWRAVVTRGQLQPGETVLIQGIGGGVALFSLQIAVAMGANVIVTSSSDVKLKQAIALGASAGINYQSEDVVARVKELTDGKGVDLAVDGGGAKTMPAAIQSVRDLGRVVDYGFVTGRTFTLDTYHLMIRQISLIGSAMHTHSELASAIRFLNHTQLRPVISDEFSLGDSVQALAKLESGAQFGKIVINIG